MMFWDIIEKAAVLFLYGILISACVGAIIAIVFGIKDLIKGE